jgi:MFS family permease
MTVFYAQSAWFPTLLMRQFHLTPASVGQLAAPAIMAGGILGVACAGMLASHGADSRTLHKTLAVPAAAAAVLLPAAVGMPFVSSSGAAVALYGVCAFAASIAMALAPVPLQIAMPNRMRGRALALLVFSTNAISGGVGPLVVGYLNERLGHGAVSLNVALAVVGGSAAVVSAALYALAARRVSDRRVLGTS